MIVKISCRLELTMINLCQCITLFVSVSVLSFKAHQSFGPGSLCVARGLSRDLLEDSCGSLPLPRLP